MYPEIPIGLALAFVVIGLYVLAWSADRFVEGAEVVARALGVSPFIIGMVIVGFGTSAPELAVSALSGLAGHSNLSLGNAYGSNIFNIAAILGIAVLIRPHRGASRHHVRGGSHAAGRFRCLRLARLSWRRILAHGRFLVPCAVRRSAPCVLLHRQAG